jgi:porin
MKSATIWCAALCALPIAAHAQRGPMRPPQIIPPLVPEQPSQPEQPEAAGPPGFWQRDTMTGDWGGLRRQLADHGVTVTLTESFDLFANLAGGIKTGTNGESLLLGQVDADLGRLLGWQGARFRVSAYDFAGQGLSAGNLGSIMSFSELEAPAPSLRIWEMWLEQATPGGAAALRVGVLALDSAGFATTNTSALFVGSTFGFPEGIASDLPAGGPIYPLSSPGVMLTLRPAEAVSVMGAVVSGDPAGHAGATWPPESYPTGTVFSLSGGALAFVQANLALPQAPGAGGPPTTFALGAWYDTSSRFADVATIGETVPVAHHGDWGVYATAEGMLYREPGSKDQGLSAFLRLAAMPAEQNLIDRYVDAGFSYKGLIPGRDDDLIGIAVAYSHVSPDARAADRAQRALDPFYPVRNGETLLELTYQAAITPWWTVQPDLQRWFHPGGNVLNPDGTVRRDALVVGLRTNVAF